MAFNINELRETLELNRGEIINNQSLTNEYMVEDIMVELGYNKRRNKNVKRLLNKPIDWEVLSTGSPRIAVKVFALGDTIEEQAVQESMNYCKDRRFSIFIVTDGEAMTVCRYNKVKRDYAEVCDISLLEELDDTKKSVLEAISNEGFNLELIDSIVSQRDISPEKVKEVLKNNLDILASHVATWMGDSSNSKIEQCKVVIGSLFSCENSEDLVTIDVSEYTSKIEELNNKIKCLTEELESTAPVEVDTTQYTDKISELESDIAEYESKLTEYENKVLEYESKIKEVSEQSLSDKTLKSNLEELNKELDSKNEKIKQLETEVKSLKENNNTGVSEDIRSEIDTYRDKIQELSTKVAESEDEISRLKVELKNAQDNLVNMSGADKQKALDLLGVIEDSKELPRSYVAVINTELIQYDDLPTFVGRSLQKLYEIKNYEASQFIFNGDIFKLVQPAERNDLIMNNKAYDVKVEGIHEDEILNKLRIVYSHFSEDIIFECKKIGSLELTKTFLEDNIDTEEVIDFDDENDADFGGDNVDFCEDDIAEVEDTEDFNETIEVDESAFEVAYEEDSSDDRAVEFEETNIGDSFGDDFEISLDEEQQSFEESFEDNFRTDVDFGMEDQVFEETNNYLNGLTCCQLLQIDSLIWSEEEVYFNNIKYIGSSSISFNINMNNEPISNEQLFCKSLDAVLALAMSMGNSNIVALLRQTDLSQINSFIKLYTEEYADYPRINGTKYVVAGIESVGQVASVLADVCNKLNIDTSDIFVFFDTSTTSHQLLDVWGYEEDAIQLREYTELRVPDTSDAIVVLKGGIFNNIIVTKNSLQAHRNIFKETTAVRTNYLAKMINSVDDFVEVIGTIITEAYSNGQYANLNLVGNVIGESYKLVSENPSEVSENRVKIDINGREVYVSLVEDWQMPLSIIKAHTALLANTSIAVKLNINSQALNFYLTEFEVAEPSLSLAVSSFCNYVKACIK